jgi:hypothetical protein
MKQVLGIPPGLCRSHDLWRHESRSFWFHCLPWRKGGASDCTLFK